MDLLQQRQKLFILSTNFKSEYIKLFNSPIKNKILITNNIIYSKKYIYQKLAFRLLYLIYNILYTTVVNHSYKKSLSQYVSIYSIFISQPLKVQLQKDNVQVILLNNDFMNELLNMINSYCSSFILYEFKYTNSKILNIMFNNIYSNSRSGQCNITFDETQVNITEYVNSLYNINDDEYKLFYNIQKCFKLALIYCYNIDTISNVINYIQTNYYKTQDNENIINDVINTFNRILFNIDNVNTILKIFYLFCEIKIQE